jgi:hypothetical protein
MRLRNLNKEEDKAQVWAVVPYKEEEDDGKCKVENTQL